MGNDEKCFEFEERNGELVLTNYNGTHEVLEVPSEVLWNGKLLPVTEINDAFNELNAVELILPDTVRSINTLFYKTLPLNEVQVIMESGDRSLLQKLKSTVNSNKTLKKIKLPANLKELCGLKKCIALESVELPDTLLKMCSFEGCISLMNIKIPPKIKILPNNCFSDCRSLENVILPENLEIISTDSFANCSKLTYLDLPPKVTLNSAAFANSFIESIVIPAGTKKLEKDMFLSANLKHVVLPEGLEIIENGAFAYTKIENIKLPDSLKVIGEGAFRGSALIEVHLPESLESIEDYAFYGCNGLKVFMSKKTDAAIDVYSTTFDSCIVNYYEDL